MKNVNTQTKNLSVVPLDDATASLSDDAAATSTRSPTPKTTKNSITPTRYA